MAEKIDKPLKRIAENMSRANSQTTSNTEDKQPAHAGLIGNPNCPHCQGLGYLRADVPVGHPDFGKVQVCVCRQGQISKQVHRRLYALSNLHELQHLTFDNFQPRGRIGLTPLKADSLERAYNHAHQFAENPKGWLLLQGPYGSGKTHLAAAIANLTVGLGISTLFITVPDLLDTLRFAYSDPDATFEERFEEIRRAPLLVLDDFGTQNATAWAQEKLFQILNFRYINRLPLVVTTNLGLEEIEGRIRSRLQDPDLVTRVKILATDYRNPADDTGYHELSSLDLMRDRTFLNFNLRRSENLTAEDSQSLEKAFNAARDFAEHPDGWLLLTGPHGCGKTHLAAAIADYRAELGDPPLFVFIPDLFDHLRATFNPNSAIKYDRRFEEVRSSSLLILDDLGNQSMTPWVQEKLHQLLNYRYNAHLPTVITSSDEIANFDPRLRSRILDTRICTIYGITAPDYHGGGRKRGNTKRKRPRS